MATDSKQVNPANVPEKASLVAEERRRIPMSLPLQKLQVPAMPGYHLYWMRGTADRIAQAQRAGYEFVSEDEVSLNQSLVGGDAKVSGNTDLGSRVSVIAGGRDFDGHGNPVRLYLMKIKEEWWLEDQKVLQDRNEQVAESLRGPGLGSENESPEDRIARYSSVQTRGLPAPKVRPNLFTRKT